MSRRHQLAAGTITIVCLCVMIVSWGIEFVHRGHSIDIDRSIEAPNVELKIDINQAAWPELTLLPEISETMARRIVEHREEHGKFKSRDEVTNVRGIGPRTLDAIEPYLFAVGEEVVERSGRELAKPN